MSSAFVKTDTVLDKIITRTVEDLQQKKRQVQLADVIRRAEAAGPVRDFVTALQKDTVALIAEVKHASPSRGILIEDFDPVRLGAIYDVNGASAISVLTDEPFFKGHLDYLTAVKQAVSVPVLRKDFTVDPYQVYEARAAGADCVLLIVMALEDDQLRDLAQLIDELGMAALVEVHNTDELERATKIQPRLLGVNNRNLKTFDVDLNTTAQLIDLAPDNVTFVAESGILDVEHVRQMGALGAHAILVGEGLVKSADVAETVSAFSSVERVSS